MARILALDTYHAGSHRDVLCAWQERSRHEIRIEALSGRHWKWRMRHAPISYAQRFQHEQLADIDLIWCTDMLDLAAWRGLAPAHIANKPHLLYMHENQLLYPDRHKQSRDAHYAFTNLSSCLAADHCAWNSAWHRDQFINEMQAHIQRMPDEHFDITSVLEKSSVLYPGFEYQESSNYEHVRPHIIWAARWEWEKGPDIFFDALALLGDEHVFDLSVVGGDAIKQDVLFERAQHTWQHRIKQWGYLENRSDYWQLLHQGDFIVSTARHEFFGLAMVEAAAAGCQPILPQRLSYPEVFAECPDAIFYSADEEGDAEALATVLRSAISNWQQRAPRNEVSESCRQFASRYQWSALIESWDECVDLLLAAD